MKLLNNKTLLLIAIILVSGYGYIASCTHKDLVLPDQQPVLLLLIAAMLFFFPEPKPKEIPHNGKWTRYIPVFMVR